MTQGWPQFHRLAESFPNPREAPPGSFPLAFGGNLQEPTLLAAYSRGLFPWFNESDPILWWSPDPRCVLFPDNFHISGRSRRAIIKKAFKITLDCCFARVIRACAAPRERGDGTWITAEMLAAYMNLHHSGYAHSIEAWRDGELVGGLYGVGLGRAFFGESMFHLESEASRAALAALVDLLRLRRVIIMDCQQASPHMLRMGAQEIPRAQFLDHLACALIPDCEPSSCAYPWRPWRRKYSWNAGEWHAV